MQAAITLGSSGAHIQNDTDTTRLFEQENHLRPWHQLSMKSGFRHVARHDVALVYQSKDQLKQPILFWGFDDGYWLVITTIREWIGSRSWSPFDQVWCDWFSNYSSSALPFRIVLYGPITSWTFLIGARLLRMEWLERLFWAQGCDPLGLGMSVQSQLCLASLKHEADGPRHRIPYKLTLFADSHFAALLYLAYCHL